MANDNAYGMLITKNLEMQRKYFKEMTRLHGVKSQYEAPKQNIKDYNAQGDLESAYYPPEMVPVIFQEYPDQKSLKKAGWVVELQEGSSIIHVPYDLPKLEVGALFTLPNGLDFTNGRKFRVISMSNIMIYPASIACEVAPEYASSETKSSITDFSGRDFTVLNDNPEDD